MTKTLTEQYKNKELSGWYYVKTKDGSINHWLLFTDTIEFEKDIEEVLAPVPSYDEYKRLQEQLKEANVVIKWYDGLEKMLIGWELCTGQKKGTAEKYLKKWGVK